MTVRDFEARRNATMPMERFDGDRGELSPEEKREAVVRFKNLLEDILLRHIGNVTIFQNLYKTAKLTLRIDFEDHSSLEFEIESSDINKDSRFTRPLELLICEIDEDGQERAQYSYWLLHDESSVMRRNDGDESNETFLESLKALDTEKTWDIFENHIANDQLEVTMGFNEQPVRMDEVLSLGKLLERARFDDRNFDT